MFGKQSWLSISRDEENEFPRKEESAFGSSHMVSKN
jgi:hypothetical protein